MNDNLITWSLKNWVTVFLMWLLGWAVISLVARTVRAKRGGSATGLAFLSGTGTGG